jgi:hypothetical protein
MNNTHSHITATDSEETITTIADSAWDAFTGRVAAYRSNWGRRVPIKHIGYGNVVYMMDGTVISLTQCDDPACLPPDAAEEERQRAVEAAALAVRDRHTRLHLAAESGTYCIS